MSAPQILIVGAGPTGLVLALRLAAHGVPFRIIDKNPGPGLASRAMGVHARTLEFYQQLGIADEVVAAGIQLQCIHVRNNGKSFADLTLRDMGHGLSPFPFMLCYPQDDHERLLVKHLQARGIEVEWGVELNDLSQSAAGVNVTLNSSRGPETTTFEYVCGCDGAHSRVRHLLSLDFAGGTNGTMFYVADVQVEGEFHADAFMNIDSHGFAMLMPVRSSGMHRLISLVPPELADRTDLKFEDIRSFAEGLLHVRVKQVNWFAPYHVHHRVAARFQVGRCFILGDAGHIHSPTGGQGMNTGIGDAVNLSWKLANVVDGHAPASLLDTYEPERIAFARKLVASTDKAFRGVAGLGLGNRLLRTFLIPYLMPVLTNFAAVRRKIFTTVSQIRISYPTSALSEGQAGNIKGGDRLPWVPMDEVNNIGGNSYASGHVPPALPVPVPDNFAPLRSLSWQLHVYGEADAAMIEACAELGLPLHQFTYGANAETAGLQQDAAYLIRPDGHVALAMPEQNVHSLHEYVNRVGVKFANAQAEHLAECGV